MKRRDIQAIRVGARDRSQEVGRVALVDRSDMLVLDSEAAGSGREVSAWTTSPTKSGEVVGNEEVFSRARVQRTLTDAEGRYDFRHLPTGITIEVATRRGTASIQEVSELKELDGDATTEIDFIISWLSNVIRGLQP